MKKNQAKSQKVVEVDFELEAPLFEEPKPEGNTLAGPPNSYTCSTTRGC